MSNNCLTGRFNYGGVNGECFAEAFHRYQYGALGLIAATQVSYSFVNDIYVWGAYDNMWPDFMPTYGTQHATNFIRPAFGNAAGKYFLRQSSWTDEYWKEITYYLFHQHGDAYMTLYTEMPQPLSVEMLPVITAGSEQYAVKADEGATICLSANGQIIGFGYATGDTQYIDVLPQETGTMIKLTITKQDYYRYEHFINTIPTTGPYLIFHDIEINDEEGNSNHAPDYDETCKLGISLHNVGHDSMEGFNVTLSCAHPSVEIIQNQFAFNSMNTDEIQMQNNAFTVHFADNLTDQEKVKFYLKMENEGHAFIDSVTLTIKAPKLKYSNLSITDLDGNEMDRLMKGQSSYLTFDIENQGSSKSKEIGNRLNLLAPFLNVAETEVAIPAVDAGATGQVTFRAAVDENAIEGIINYILQAESGHYTDMMESNLPLGYTSEDFEGETLNEDMQWRLGLGSRKWYVAEDSTAHGGHCLRSPSISSGNAILNIGIATDVSDKISFLHKTMAEGDSKLQFNLNGKDIDEWSGDSDWDCSEYDLPAGNNLIRFTFKKDASGGSDDDVAMLDYICLPPLAKMVMYAGDDIETCPNATFTPKGYIYNQSECAWTTNGDGTFDDATLEHPTYTFGETDKAEGQVELTLTGTSTINGSQSSSTVTVSLLPYFDPSYSPEIPSGTNEIDLRLVSQSEYMAEEVEDVIYTWSIEPETAGTIVGESSHALVEWNSDYRGEAKIMYAYENTCGATSVSEPLKVNIFNSTGIHEQQSIAVEVYPNPANGILYVKTNLEGEATLRVVDLLGRVVYELSGSFRLV